MVSELTIRRISIVGTLTTAPSLPERNALLPPNTPSEIRPSTSERLGVFATKTIPPESKIFVEIPLCVIENRDNDTTAQDVSNAYNKLDPRQRKLLTDLMSFENDREDFRNRSPLLETFQRNNSSLRGSGSARGLCPISSRFNNSCVPNAQIPTTPLERYVDGTTVQIFALRRVAPNEEISFTYEPSSNFLPTNLRQEVALWDFICRCSGCELDRPNRTVSDMRRTLLGTLYVLIVGKGFPNCEVLKSIVARLDIVRGPGNITTCCAWAGYVAAAEGDVMFSMTLFTRDFLESA